MNPESTPQTTPQTIPQTIPQNDLVTRTAFRPIAGASIRMMRRHWKPFLLVIVTAVAIQLALSLVVGVAVLVTGASMMISPAYLVQSPFAIGTGVLVAAVVLIALYALASIYTFFITASAAARARAQSDDQPLDWSHGTSILTSGLRGVRTVIAPVLAYYGLIIGLPLLIVLAGAGIAAFVGPAGVVIGVIAFVAAVIVMIRMVLRYFLVPFTALFGDKPQSVSSIFVTSKQLTSWRVIRFALLTVAVSFLVTLVGNVLYFEALVAIVSTVVSVWATATMVLLYLSITAPRPQPTPTAAPDAGTVTPPVL